MCDLLKLWFVIELLNIVLYWIPQVNVLRARTAILFAVMRMLGILI
jgi:hypothetical protein